MYNDLRALLPTLIALWTSLEPSQAQKCRLVSWHTSEWCYADSVMVSKNEPSRSVRHISHTYTSASPRIPEFEWRWRQKSLGSEQPVSSELRLSQYPNDTRSKSLQKCPERQNAIIVNSYINATSYTYCSRNRFRDFLNVFACITVISARRTI